MTKAKRLTKKVFISIAAGVEKEAGIYEEGCVIKITPEQLVECRKIIGLEYVTKILSLYYGLKDKEEPVSHEQEES